MNHILSPHHQGLHLHSWIPFLFYISLVCHLLDIKAWRNLSQRVNGSSGFCHPVWCYLKHSLNHWKPSSESFCLLPKNMHFMGVQHTCNPTYFPKDCYKPCLFHTRSSIIPAAGMWSPWEALRFTWLPLTTCGFSLASNNTVSHNTVAYAPILTLISTPSQPGHQSSGGADQLTNA